VVVWSLRFGVHSVTMAAYPMAQAFVIDEPLSMFLDKGLHLLAALRKLVFPGAAPNRAQVRCFPLLR
jgi:hypothetical protein